MYLDNTLDIMQKKILFASGIIVLLFCSLLAIDVLFPVEGVTGRQECSVCGMWIDQYERTHHVVITKNGKTEHYCSFACAAKGIEIHKGEIEAIKTADFTTKRLIDADKAYYLEGSNIPGVMSYISRIAFASEADAKKFQKQYGGRIVTLKQALDES
jgi:nitrous oxide reductase accessory protein NosL